jgi:hypothetical protein
LNEDPREPGFPRLDRIAGRELDRQHDDEHADEHVTDAGSRRHRAHIRAAGAAHEIVGEPAIVARGEKQHQADRREDAAKDQLIGKAEDESQQPGEREEIDEDVGAEAEKGVPIAGHPEFRAEDRGGHGRRGRAVLRAKLAERR